MPFSSTNYGPDTVAILGRAFSDAWSEIQESGSLHIDQEAGRADLARRILAAAADGERDPDRLKVLALSGFPAHTP